jgi:hypothetical protein
MDIDVRAPADLPDGWTAAPWRVPNPALAPARLAAQGHDPRWSVRFVVAADADRLYGLTPVCRPRTSVMADRNYDLSRLCGAPDDAIGWLVIGGCRDLRGGFLVAGGPGLDEPAHIAAVREALARRAFSLARDEGLFVAAAYLDDEDAGACQRALGGADHAIKLGEAAAIPVPSGTLDDFVATLPPDRRRKARRDWRLFDAAGLRVEVMPVAEAVADGAPLVAAVKRRYGVPDDPRLATYRLRQWLAAAAGEYLAFAVRDRYDRVVTISFALRYGNSLEVHEIGMVDDDPVRHLGYLEAGFYQPIRYAQRHGCVSIELGMGALGPKQHRGATLTSLWLVHA